MSWQLRCLNHSLRYLVKPRLRRTEDPVVAARDFERAARWLFRTPPHTLCLTRPGSVPMSWISVGRCAPRRVILYLHGGAYFSGSAQTHMGMLARLSKMTRVEVCVPGYRLLQVAPFPAAFDDAVSAWDHLMRLYAPQEIVLGGDSAGGGLMLALLAELCGRGTPPAAAFALSPWCDLTLGGESIGNNRDRDPLIPVERMEETAQRYLDGAQPEDPRASPLFARFDEVPPVLIQCGDCEVLLSDATRMQARLGATARLDIWKDTPHVWQIFDGWVPEARAALRGAADFVQISFEAVSR
ncbi:Acetyl esterase/lipase [Salinihabitans flavidus]|uniref:Acetyl esterase/lipase n=1 Tax=Salinihabitans flavidus TaxID=569882 RepID=A0A1H8LDT1_9RHOB|nr:alpha/beta hydrolase [Salinihabitans flavidus]SEO02888.1 Acetyl esterase/lipase [Salinihabitans flavidus]